MRQSTKNLDRSPGMNAAGSDNAASEMDPGMIAFPAAFNGRSPLDELVLRGARQMLQTALESEVQAFLDQHAARVDEQGRRLVVRNGALPAREILTGAGRIEVTQPRVRDQATDPAERVRFS